MSRARLAAVAVLVALAGCGGSDPAALSDEDRAAWAGVAPDRAVVPVLVYDGVGEDEFARQMALLDSAGFETITLGDLVRFVQGRPVDLPDHPLVLTFADARRDTWANSDGALRRRGFNGVLFADIGPIEKHDPDVLTWKELDRLEGDRWDVQLGSGTGDPTIRFGPDPGDVGEFYAYRGSDEVLGGWRERVFSDLTYGEEQLAFHIDGYRALAFAPPGGNYGQLATNDRHIPRELLARALLSFDLVFTQDRSGFAEPGAKNPLGRFEVTPAVGEEELRAMLATSR